MSTQFPRNRPSTPPRMWQWLRARWRNAMPSTRRMIGPLSEVHRLASDSVWSLACTDSRRDCLGTIGRDLRDLAASVGPLTEPVRLQLVGTAAELRRAEVATPEELHTMACHVCGLLNIARWDLRALGGRL